MPLEKVCGKIYIRENEMLQELPDVGQFILAMDTWFEKLMEK